VGASECDYPPNCTDALEHQVLCYQNSWTYKELEGRWLLDETIDEMGTMPWKNVGIDESSWQKVKELIIKEIKEVSDYLLEVHGVPPGWKGEGITRLIYENLNGLQSMLLKKNEKLEMEQRVIDNLQVDIVCYNELWQNLWHK
jgi:hypothetical protein